MVTASSPRFLADENFNNNLLRALLQALPTIDIIRVQDTSVAGADDPTLLAWAAQEARILLTHDVQTIPRFAYDRVRAGLRMPGIIEVSSSLPLGPALDDLVLLVSVTQDDEWADQVRFIPLR